MSKWQRLAQERGRLRAENELLNGADCANPSPLSGEWAGESVLDLVGDLIRMNGGEDAWDEVCEAYEVGYFDRWAEFDDGECLCEIPFTGHCSACR